MLIRDHIEQAIQVFVEAEDPEERSLAFEELAEARGAGALLARRVRKMPARLHPILVALAERIAGIEGLQLLEALLQAGDEATEEAALLAIGTLGEAAGMLTLLNWLASSASLEQRPTLFLSLLELSSLDQAGFGATLPQLDSAILGEVARILSQQDQGLAPELLELGRSAQRELRKTPPAHLWRHPRAQPRSQPARLWPRAHRRRVAPPAARATQLAPAARPLGGRQDPAPTRSPPPARIPGPSHHGLGELHRPVDGRHPLSRRVADPAA